MARIPTNEPTRERILEVISKYRPLFERQPTWHGHGPSSLRDENGERTKTRGIIVRVTKKVDLSALPPEDRIPDCLEGVPVQIIEEEEAQLAMLLREDTDKEEAHGSA